MATLFRRAHAPFRHAVGRGGHLPEPLLRRHLHVTKRNESTIVIAGLSVAALATGVNYAMRAAEQMRADGFNVLMEGRAQTLDYVRTPHRFELTLSEPNIIGMRRAAQRMMGEALKALKANEAATVEGVHAALAAALAAMAK